LTHPVSPVETVYELAIDSPNNFFPYSLLLSTGHMSNDLTPAKLSRYTAQQQVVSADHPVLLAAFCSSSGTAAVFI
jgi:hypothetical protein